MHIIDISGAVATIRKHETLTKGRVGAVVQFLFDKDWTGLTKMAVFRQGDVTKDYVMSANMAVVPWECLESIGLPVEIGVYGIGSGGDIVIPTIWARTKEVREGADPSGDESLDPTLPVWAQILALMGDLNELKTENKETLVAAINEVLTTALTMIGDLEELDTEAKDSLVAAVNEVVASILALDEAISGTQDIIGNPEELETTTKVSLVAAVNEVVRSVSRLNDTVSAMSGKIGDLNGLNTKAKTSLVAAINEILATHQNPLPGGGTAGQFLTLDKSGNAAWADAPEALPAGGKSGQILTVDGNGNPAWSDAPEGGSTIPDNGSVGQVLTKTSAGYGWADIPAAEDEIPTGGTKGQVLTNTGSGYGWADLPDVEAELPSGGSNGQVLTLVSGSPKWQDIPESEDEIPAGGTAGQVLTKTSGGYGWANLPEVEAELPSGGTEGQLLMRNASGGVEWGDIDTEAFEIVNVTGDIDGGYTADKTGVELVEAANAGKQLLCIVNNAIRLQAVWVDSDTPQAVWFSGNLGGTLSTVTVHTTGTVTVTSEQVGGFHITPKDLVSSSSGGGFGSLTTEVYTVDKTISEIDAALSAGEQVFLDYTDADAYWKIPMVRQLATLSHADGVLYFYSMINEDYVVSATMRNKDGAPQVSITTGPASRVPWGGTDGQVLTLVSGSPAWADASGGGAGVLYVNVTTTDGTTYTADKTIDEIIEAYNSGYAVFAVFFDALLSLSYAGETEAAFCIVTVDGNDTKETTMTTLVVTESGVYFEQAQTSHSLPTGGTAGQVLTIGSDGSPVWADPVATSAEGVEFG